MGTLLVTSQNSRRMEKAKRYNEGKLRWALVDFKALEELVRVLEMGAEKYGDDNWKLGLPYTQVCESAMRHLLAFLSGENTDKESGRSHLAHVMANMMFLQSYVNSNMEHMDDRSEK